MPIRLLSTPAELDAYDRWVKTHPHGNLWQSLERKTYLEALGREVRLYAVIESGTILASAEVVIDKTTFGFSTWDIPRGPLTASGEEARATSLIEHVERDARNNRCMSLFLSPTLPLETRNSKLLPSSRHIHAQATRVVDLTLSEENLLKQMKPKGRYNIKVAERHGIRIEESRDVDGFARLVMETAKRDGFTALPASKYRAFLEHLPGSFLLLAYASDKSVAGLMGVIWSKTGIYYYGASDYAHRPLMAPFLLQWEAMKYCKAKECTTYDLLGIAPPEAASVELQARSSAHPWQGITAFKEKFGGDIVTYPQEQEIRLKPIASAMLQLKRKFF